jgi:hypothetical protein
MRLVALATAFLVAGAAHAATPLDDETIRDTVTDRRIYLQVPLGGEFPLFYRSGGRVDGSGTATGLGVLTRVSDTGRWWVANNRLCQRWNTHENGRQFCFRLLRLSGDRLRWERDDGLSGTARIGR